MRIIGADPGINGGIALVGASPGSALPRLLDAIDLPTVGEGTKREINVPDLCAWIESCRQGDPDLRAYVEFVTAMPSQGDVDPNTGKEIQGSRRGMGAASAFKFGFSAGQLRAAIASRGIPITVIVPIKWKAFHNLKGATKESARLLACRRWPDHAGSTFRLKCHHNRAEAGLIAAYGYVIEKGTQ